MNKKIIHGMLLLIGAVLIVLQIEMVFF